MFHYHRLLCAGFCAHTDWAKFMTLFNSRSKDSTELLILPNPKCSFVGSVKSHAVPFKHDAHPMNESQPHEPTVIFSDIPRVRSILCAILGTLMSFLFNKASGLLTCIGHNYVAEAASYLSQLGGEAIMTSSVIKSRSVTIAGHKTSVSLEDAFWKSLREIAEGRDETLYSLNRRY